MEPHNVLPHPFFLLVLGCGFLILGAWFLIFGYWLLVIGYWLLVLNVWFLVLDSWFLVLGSWFLVRGSRFLILGSRRSLEEMPRVSHSLLFSFFITLDTGLNRPFRLELGDEQEQAPPSRVG